ncbi:methyltransferase domain-containing protein [Ramlibacter sp. XY19]|uniref:class I SAM-dependent methyltransferase n=1 Tax=Ramlibacter paludis TaxID=2908000 RepID=UPI0023DCA17D|nr:methyltransferase domain-containing protein [Ramlibacter paludis]MCG2592696.1 methyltransferase domain-containing protein [Ramlibacter paludis]
MAMPSGGRRPPDLSAALLQYRRRADRYDLELLPFEPLRGEAIAQLDLHDGDTVLDVGCGTGLSFEALEQRIGPRGHIVGVDPSPDMLVRAVERITAHHWRNVELVRAGAADAPLQGRADAALFHFTHDVLRDPAALGHVLAHLKPGAHVAATGLQWAPPWMVATNAFVLGAALYSVSSLDGLDCPWDRLASHLDDVHVQSAWMGGIYILSGRVAMH